MFGIIRDPSSAVHGACNREKVGFSYDRLQVLMPLVRSHLPTAPADHDTAGAVMCALDVRGEARVHGVPHRTVERPDSYVPRQLVVVVTEVTASCWPRWW